MKIVPITSSKYVFSLQRGDIDNHELYLKLPKLQISDCPNCPILLIRDIKSNQYVRIDDLIDLTIEELYSIALQHLVKQSVLQERVFIEEFNKFIWVFKGDFASIKILDNEFLKSKFGDIPLSSLMFSMPQEDCLIVTLLSKEQIEITQINNLIRKEMEDTSISKPNLTNSWLRYNNKKIIPVIQETHLFNIRQNSFQKLRHRIGNLIQANNI